MTGKLIATAIYLGCCFWLSWKAWKETGSNADYMLAGRQAGPFVMAMSYGATFISTSAIIGFGGAAAMFGFSVLWLTVLNIGVGVFIAMVFFGRRTRRMGLALDSHTFPELLGRRYDSRFIQGFSGSIIFLFIPVYAAAVLIGIARLAEVSLGVPYVAALLSVTAILALYVITGGIKAVMYTDAFQGTLMVLMMLMLVGYTYWMLGGVIPAHETLSDMAPLMPEKLRAGGMLGWTQGTVTGSPLWLVIYTTIVYGVGVGVLAQPQLAVRYMTVPSDRELHRAVLFGGVFILLMTGVAFTVGALSNAVFFQKFGKIAIQMGGGNVDKIIPAYVETMMPGWFSGFFLLAMMAAAMSTMSGQYHTGGTALGHDIITRTLGRKQQGLAANRIGVVITILASLVWAWVLPGSVIARATAFFFGLCAATFLPAYSLGLYWRGMTKTGAKVSMLGGFAASMFWLLFIHEKEAAAIGLCRWLTGKATLVADAVPGSALHLLQWVDPNVVALPLSFLLAAGVSTATRPVAREHLDLCYSRC
ncbi:sodium:solute symporter family protein [Oleidesulfovibrio alaskensis]|uniref:sodium:solute symporter family protein n=1 Tax=Oleidesulfovibrio alaskensis TaxID=58180 RepID=UPI0003FB596B|nr:sodium:solute symporter family protein [Oleidesulfovibrio alaskensis]